MSYNLIGNGVGNSAHTGNYSTVVNGYHNDSSGAKSFIGNGYKNNVGGGYTAIVGGRENNASGSDGFIGGGVSNILSGTYGVVAGGIFNKATSSRNFIGGGASNSATTQYSIVVGGSQNLASGNRSAILNGSGNTVSGAYSAVIGGQGINGTQASTVYVPNLNIQIEKKIYVSTGGTIPTSGIIKLTGGTATVSTSAITDASFVFLTEQNNLGNAGAVYIENRTAGSSFVINSTNASDSNLVAWWIVEPV